MSKKLRFEEAFDQKMKNISSPDEEVSWQKMSKLLDDNERQKPIGFFNNYFWLSLLVGLLLIGGWYALDAYKNAQTKSIAQTVRSLTNVTTTNNNNSIPPISTNQNSQKLTPTTETPNVSSTSDKINNGSKEINKSARIEQVNLSQPIIVAPTEREALKVNNAPERSTVLTKNKSIFHKRQNAIATNLNEKNTNPLIKSSFTSEHKTKKNRVVKITPDAPITVSEIKAAITAFNTTATPIPDSLTTVKKVPTIEIVPNNLSLSKEKSTDSLSNKKEKNKLPNLADTKNKKTDSNKKYFASVGIGFHQQIPLNGQKVVSLGYNAKSGIADYIPSIYLRLERDQKWFVQGEFNYGNPQYVKSFSYFMQTHADAAGNIITTSYHLQKTFYSEIPVSFNYYIRQNWSAGVGGMYSWFHGAIAEKEINSKNVQTQQETVIRQVVPIKDFTDSFLYRSQTYLLFQTDYQWRRFSFGLRYSRDLQPYIKYTLPNGIVEDKRNWSLEFILRFQLWKSVKF